MTDDEQDLTSIPGVGPTRAEALQDIGLQTVSDVTDSDVETLATAEGFGIPRAETLKESALGNDVSTDGRPSKFKDARESILEAARRGTTKEGCARAGGVTYETLRTWLDEKSEFFAAFKRARAEGESALVEATAEQNPKFVLERSYDYVKKQEIEHSGDVSGTHTVELDSETAAAIRGATAPDTDSDSDS